MEREGGKVRMKTVVCFVSGPLFCPSVDVRVDDIIIPCVCPHKNFRNERECAYLSILNTLSNGRLRISQELDVSKSKIVELSVDDRVVERLLHL